ncbi:hypothetical protein NIES25_44300 [Nostoc linckia NIES-25]|nr:hypothetical protein NIES25_44300 [Nostoc linckia NIES-25]
MEEVIRFILLTMLIARPAKIEALTTIPKNIPVFSRVIVIPGELEEFVTAIVEVLVNSHLP